MTVPIGIGTLLSVGSTVIGGALSSGAKSDAAEASNAANQKAIGEAKEIAQGGYDKNLGYINEYGQKAQGRLDTGYESASGRFDPLIADGDKARGYYTNAAGLNGEAARGDYVNQLMARPEYTAANDAAQQQVMQRYGNKQGSGAMARAMQSNQMRFASQAIDQDMARVKPIMDTGNQARYQQANVDTAYGNNSAGNDWRMGNAFISNQNKLTDANVNLAGASGQSNAANANAQGAADAQMFQGFGNAFSSAFGGNNNQNNQRTLSSVFS